LKQRIAFETSVIEQQASQKQNHTHKHLHTNRQTHDQLQMILMLMLMLMPMGGADAIVGRCCSWKSPKLVINFFLALVPIHPLIHFTDASHMKQNDEDIARQTPKAQVEMDEDKSRMKRMSISGN
jgi:hypothetical protein